MKMKYLRTFEQYQGDGYDFGRFNDEDLENATPEITSDFEEDEFNEFEEDDDVDFEDDELTYTHEVDKCDCPDCACGQDIPEEDLPRRWGDEDEIVEKKKMNAGFAAYLAKKKAGKKDDKKDDKKDKKEDKKEEKEEKGSKGLSAAQKKLPPALQKAILAKKKK
jgi:hypothetical protein